MMAGRGFSAKNSGPPFNNIHIDLKHAPLRPQHRHGIGHGDLNCFSNIAAAWPKKEIFRGLHGDRARSPFFSAPIRLVQGNSDR